MRRTALCAAQPAQGLRSVGDESDDGHGRAQWWSGAPASGQRQTGRRRRAPHDSRYLGKISIGLIGPIGPMIDSHQHFWQVGRFDYPWMTSDLGVLYRDYFPDDL